MSAPPRIPALGRLRIEPHRAGALLSHESEGLAEILGRERGRALGSAGSCVSRAAWTARWTSSWRWAPVNPSLPAASSGSRSAGYRLGVIGRRHREEATIVREAGELIQEFPEEDVPAAAPPAGVQI